MLRLGSLAVFTFACSELFWRKVIFSKKAGVTLFVSFHAVFQTICDVEVHVIDINDQIPIFEKSDVSILNTILGVPISFDKCLNVPSMSIECQWETSHLQNK